MRVARKLLALGMLNGAAWGLVWSVLAPYLRSLGYTGTEYGLMGGTAVFSGAVMTLVGGGLSDRVGARRVAAVGLLLQSAALFLISRGTFATVSAGFFLNGAANGLAFTSIQALVARSGRDEVLHYTFSYVSAMNTLGGAIGSFAGWAPVLAGRLLGVPIVEAYRWTIAASSLLPLISAPLALAIPEELGPSGERKGLREGLKYLRGRFARVAVANVLIGFGAAMSIHNIDYYFAAKYGVTSAQLGSIFGLQQLFMAILMTMMPRLADRAGGPLKVYLAVSYSSIPLLVAMTLTNSFAIASALYLVRSILMNVANPLFNAFVMRLVPREMRGTASALLSLSWTLPAGGGRAVGGYLLDINLELPLRLTAVLYTVALTYIALEFRDQLRSAEVDIEKEAEPCPPP
ncbi:MAG: MFS transporter, partial [Desulfurococcales archaeon]|nr:MFS transporter [Desulfurococcales archaeon]